MKNNHFLLVILFGIILLACLQTLGCFHHNSHSTISDNTSTKILIDNREISSDTEIDQNFGELSLQIAKGSCENGFISVSQVLENSTSSDSHVFLSQNSLPFMFARLNSSNINDEFEIVSQNTYNIKLTNRNNNPMLLSSPAKLTFSINNNYPTTSYYAVKKNGNNFSLIAPNRYTSSNLSFDTYSMSEWFLIKGKRNSKIEKTPIITCPSTIFTNGKDSCFKNDLEVKISVPYNGKVFEYVLPSDLVLVVTVVSPFAVIFPASTFTVPLSLFDILIPLLSLVISPAVTSTVPAF